MASGGGSSVCSNLAVISLLVVCLASDQGFSLNMTSTAVSQSSNFYDMGLDKTYYAEEAADDNRNTFSHTISNKHESVKPAEPNSTQQWILLGSAGSCNDAKETNAWWLADLREIYCLRKVIVVNRQGRYDYRLAGAVVRAGLNSLRTDNEEIGSPVTLDQANSGEDLEFKLDAVFMAEYVSVELPSPNPLHLSEVYVDEVKDSEMTSIGGGWSMDITLVVNPAVLPVTGNGDAIIAAYKGPGDVTAGVSFGRQGTTGAAEDALPTGALAMYDPSLGCAVRVLSLPESGALNRTGLLFARATNYDETETVQSVVLPESVSSVHVSPAERTYVASAGDTVVLQMKALSPPSDEYRWRRDGGDVLTDWNGNLSVTLVNVSATDAGVYTCFVEGHELLRLHGISRLIVRDCADGMWGPPSCQDTCRRCYNGGVCHDGTGACVCPPGFSGDSCQLVHGRNVFGKTASHNCPNQTDPHGDACRGRLLCLPDPYGCSCAAGYTELNCTEECDMGKFGADCKQTCNCEQQDTCLKDTGECTAGSCTATFFGVNCQCSTELPTLGLTVAIMDDDRELPRFDTSWQPDPCVSGHKLKYELTKTGKHDVIVEPQNVTLDVDQSDTSYSIEGLQKCAEYNVYIHPLYNATLGPSTSKSALRTPRGNAPTTVTSVTGTSEAPDSIALQWTQVFCSDHYGVQYALTNKDACQPIQSPTYVQHCECIGNQNYTTIADLFPHSTYRVKVSASVDGVSGPTQDTNFTTEMAAPRSAPSTTGVTSTQQRNVTFSWAQPACGNRSGVITGYNYTFTGMESDTREDSTTDDQITIGELVPFTEYTFKVAARTVVSMGPYSEEMMVTTLEAEPTVPLDVRIQSIEEISINLSWSTPNPPHGIITQYNVRHWKAGQENNTTLETNLTGLIHQIDGLEANTLYFIEVQAETVVGPGPWSADINAMTSLPVPGRVQNLRVVGSNETSVTLNWDPSTGQIISYLVEYRILAKPGESNFPVNDEYVNTTTPSAPYSPIDLSPATLYEFRVSAQNKWNIGQPSSVETYTKPLSAPPAPELPKLVGEVTESTVTIAVNDAVSNKESVDSCVVQVQRVLASRVAKREAFVPRRYEDSPDNYIAAEWSSQNVPETFKVGDNQMYGGYLNAPLITGSQVEISVGSISKGNEMNGFVTFSPPIKVKVEEPGNPAVIVAPIIIAILAVCALVAGVLFYRRRSTSSVKKGGEMDGTFQPGKADAIDNVQDRSSTCYTNEGAVEMTSRRPAPERPEQGLSAEAEVQSVPVTSNPVSCQELAEFIQAQEQAPGNGLHQEYKNLSDDPLFPWTVASKAENKSKNRYANVIAYDHSRVVLEPLDGDPHSDYINACYIDGYKKKNKYIASQGPNKASLADLWRMIWQYKVEKIVMLTNPIEKGKTKCLQYWSHDEPATYLDIEVITEKEEVFLDYTIRTFRIGKVGDEGKKRTVRHYHYTTWPDMTPPEYPGPVLNFLRLVNADHTNGWTVVHCSAGVGRTGTFIALDALLEQMTKEGQVDVLGFVHSMRQKRIKMVQTADQYEFLYDALLAAHLTGKTTFNKMQFQQEITNLKKVAAKRNDTAFKEQFELLGKLSVVKPRRAKGKSKRKSGTLSENLDKNRYPNFVPSDHVRPFVTTTVYENDGNYINATFLPGYHRKNMFIATQMPMPNTVADIWRLVYDQKATSIVMLNSLDSDDPSMRSYWPEKGSMEYGPLVIELLQTKQLTGVIERTFSLSKKSTKFDGKRTVSQFQYLDWPTNKEVPSTYQGMLTLMGLTQTFLGGSNPIVVHCIDGLGCSSVYCTLMALLEQSMSETVVDVFQAAQRLRMVNENMMYSAEHYALCYEVLQAYIDSTTIYENVSPSEKAK